MYALGDLKKTSLEDFEYDILSCPVSVMLPKHKMTFAEENKNGFARVCHDFIILLQCLEFFFFFFCNSEITQDVVWCKANNSPLVHSTLPACFYFYSI